MPTALAKPCPSGPVVTSIPAVCPARCPGVSEAPLAELLEVLEGPMRSPSGAAASTAICKLPGAPRIRGSISPGSPGSFTLWRNQGYFTFSSSGAFDREPAVIWLSAVFDHLAPDLFCFHARFLDRGVERALDLLFLLGAEILCIKLLPANVILVELCSTRWKKRKILRRYHSRGARAPVSQIAPSSAGDHRHFHGVHKPVQRVAISSSRAALLSASVPSRSKTTRLFIATSFGIIRHGRLRHSIGLRTHRAAFG